MLLFLLSGGNSGAPPLTSISGFAASIINDYRDALNFVGEPADIKIRRYSGTGIGRSSADTEITARVISATVAGRHDDALIGALQEGTKQVIALAQDLVDAGFALPLRSSDRVVIEDKEHVITRLDDQTRKVAGTLIAYDLVVKG